VPLAVLAKPGAFQPDGPHERTYAMTKRKKTKRTKKFAPPTLTITVTVTQGEAVWELNDRTNDWLASDQAEAIDSINKWLSEYGAKGLSDE
jgi:hypothetical protein